MQRSHVMGLLIGSLAFSTICWTGARGDAVADLTTQLNKCRQDVIDDRQAIADADELLALARAHKLVVVPILGGGAAPVDPELYGKALFMMFISKEISREELEKAIKQIASAGQATVKAFGEQHDEFVKERDADEAKCAALAEQLQAAQKTQPSAAGSAAASSGAKPLELVLTLEGATVVTDIETQHQMPGPNDPSVVRQLQSGGKMYGGTVEVRNGVLPAGTTITVWHPTPSNVLLTTDTGGDYSHVTQPPGFGASTGVGAYVCTHFPDHCSAQANISIQWKP